MNTKLIVSALGLAAVAASVSPAQAQDFDYRDRGAYGYHVESYRSYDDRGPRGVGELTDRVHGQWERISRAERRGVVVLHQVHWLRDRERRISERLHDLQRFGTDRRAFWELRRDIDRQDDMISHASRGYGHARW